MMGLQIRVLVDAEQPGLLTYIDEFQLENLPPFFSCSFIGMARRAHTWNIDTLGQGTVHRGGDDFGMLSVYSTLIGRKASGSDNGVELDKALHDIECELPHAILVLPLPISRFLAPNGLLVSCLFDARPKKTIVLNIW